MFNSKGRYQRPINPAFVAGLEVDYRSGFWHHSGKTQRVKIDRVLKTGHFIVKFPGWKEGEPGREVKFQITGQDYAYEVKDNRYRSCCYLLTDEYLKEHAERQAYDADQQRRKQLAHNLRQISEYGVSVEDMEALEAIIAKYVKPEETK